MDYKDQDGNGESLFGARNENSVLFSLDSLTAMDEDTSSANAGSNPSGDASGLINLSTLSAMSNDSDSDDSAGVAMESMVFNQVVTKKSKRKRLIIIIVIAVLVIGCGIGIYVIYNSMSAEKAAVEAEAAKRAAELKEATAMLEAERDSAALAKQQAEDSIKKMDKVVEEQKAKMDALQVQLEAGAANNAGDNDNKPEKSVKNDNTHKAVAEQPKPESHAPKALPVQPSKADIGKALKACNQRAQKCGKGDLKVAMLINKKGSAKNVKGLSGSLKGKAGEKCIVDILEKYDFPKFTGNAIQVKYSFEIK